MRPILALVVAVAASKLSVAAETAFSLHDTAISTQSLNRAESEERTRASAFVRIHVLGL